MKRTKKYQRFVIGYKLRSSTFVSRVFFHTVQGVNLFRFSFSQSMQNFERLCCPLAKTEDNCKISKVSIFNVLI